MQLSLSRACLAGFVLLAACSGSAPDSQEPLVPAYYALARGFDFDFSEAQRAEVQASLPFDRISLWREGCYGICPVYRVDFYADGRVRFEGTEYVEPLGEFEVEGRLRSFALLAANVEAMELLSMDDRYAAAWTDDETVTVELVGPLGTKRIEDYGGQGPPLLLAFTYLVDGLAGEIDWQ